MKNINWKYCQENSDLILCSGIQLIVHSQIVSHIQEIENDFGNYLISHKNTYYYIGETKALQKRIKQQFTEKTSTFYKNYLRTRKYFEIEKIPILDFDLQIIYTKIGRKEVEEFGMVNLPTKLNKFERGKRNKVNLTGKDELWLKVQDSLVDLLVEGEEDFFKREPGSWNNSYPQSNAGIYLVRDSNDDIIYIGESSDIRERYTTHSSTTYFSALRRHIGTEIFNFKFIDDKKRKFSDANDLKVTHYLRECRYSSMPVNFGRYELEEYLIGKHKPMLNRKGNK